MYSSLIELLAVAFFGACLYHSWRTEGQQYAQQWFAAGYYFALLGQVLSVQFGVISYSDQLTKFGSAPALASLLIPALLYMAYALARWTNSDNDSRRMYLTMFLLTPALALPIDATALQFDWWSWPSGSISFLNGIPYFVPLAWGLTGTLFYAFIRFVRRIRFTGNGQLFALILGTPVITGIDLLLIALAQVVVGLLSLAPQNILLDSLMLLVLIVAPLGFALWRPKPES